MRPRGAPRVAPSGRATGRPLAHGAFNEEDLFGASTPVEAHRESTLRRPWRVAEGLRHGHDSVRDLLEAGRRHGMGAPAKVAFTAVSRFGRSRREP